MAGLQGVLDQKTTDLRAEARSALEDLRAELAGFGATREDLDTVRQAARDLDELFLLVVVGEFNAGKSALINSLLGVDLLEEGVTPTTTCINILRYGPSRSERWLNEYVLEREFDSSLLRDVAVVDTPGTNAILQHHQQLTEQFIPRSDLVLFITSAERPFTESERVFMQLIRAWGKKVVLVVNKTDLLRDASELDQVETFVAENVQQLLGFRPRIFALSARRAREASQPPDVGFTDLLQFILVSLSAENRVKLKLSNPLAIALRIADKYLAVARDRIELLAEDDRAGHSIEEQLDYYRTDMRAQFDTRLLQAESIVFDLARRGDRFFDETLRLARIFDLVNSDKIRGDFEREVVSNTSEQIEDSVDAIANGVVDREIQLWKGVAEELGRRRQALEGEVVLGAIGGDFDRSRRELIQKVTLSARQVIASFDRAAEARVLGDTMREAVAHTALAEVGAIGFGTLVAVLIGTMAADISGILAGSVLAGLGLFIIPARKQKVQKQFRQRTDELRTRLRDSLTAQLNAELDLSVERMQTSVAPYLRFVRSEQEKMSRIHKTLTDLGDRMGALRREIGIPTFEQ